MRCSTEHTQRAAAAHTHTLPTGFAYAANTLTCSHNYGRRSAPLPAALEPPHTHGCKHAHTRAPALFSCVHWWCAPSVAESAYLPAEGKGLQGLLEVALQHQHLRATLYEEGSLHAHAAHHVPAITRSDKETTTEVAEVLV